MAGLPDTAQPAAPAAVSESKDQSFNVPLEQSPNERARELLDIDAKFKVDPAEMNPDAASYVRRHPCLSLESMRKWRVGYLPRDGGGDIRTSLCLRVERALTCLGPTPL